MFIENKYTKIYYQLMLRAKHRSDVYPNEKHHIIPKSLGGTNMEDNIVNLSPREHFISHVLLTKMVDKKSHKRSMAYALVRMKFSNNLSGYSRIGNGKLYEKVRKEAIKLMSGKNNPFYNDHRFAGKNNPFYGKQHTKECREHISKMLTGKIGEKNSFYGKKHTNKTKKIISDNQREPVTIIFLDGKNKSFRKKGDIGKYLKISKALGIQLCTIKRHLWTKYNIKEILYADNINSKN